MSTISVLNTDVGLSGKTIQDLESTQSVSGLKTFNRSPSAPFAVQASSSKVTNLDADKVDGFDLDQNVATAGTPSFAGLTSTGTLAVTGASTLTGKVTAPNSVISLRGVDYTLPSAAPTIDGQALTGTTLGVTSWATPVSAVTLLAQISGTSTAAGATNFALASISGLTVKDSLWVIGTLESAAQITASAFLYSTTDSKNIAEIDGTASISTGMTIGFESIICPAQSSASLYSTRSVVTRQTADDTDTNAAAKGYRNTMSTAWTGSWNLALRHGGVTAGGTFKYEVKVYKIAGQ